MTKKMQNDVPATTVLGIIFGFAGGMLRLLTTNLANITFYSLFEVALYGFVATLAGIAATTLIKWLRKKPWK